MPMLHFRKRRQPDATAKPPRPVNVNVDVEPLPRASKFKNMVDSRRASTMFRSSGGDLRRAAHPSRGDLRQDQAATRTASATIKLAPEVPSLPRQDVRPESMRCTSGESSVDGHSEAYVPTRTKRLDSSPMLTPPVASPDDVASITATVGTPAGERGPGLSIVAPSAALAARELDTVLAQADGILSASPTSAVFATPPQRASEDAFSPSPRALSTAFPTDAAVAVTTPAVTRPIPPKNERTISSLSALSNPPGSPRKLSLVIQSAPMPLPIANLPVLTPTSPTVATAWGELARMGGPKSPARSRTGSMQGGFSWPASRAAAPATEGNEDLSEADLHSVTKTMPVMLRVPSQQPTMEPIDDGGDAGDDDSITESEEMLRADTPEASSSNTNKAKGVVRDISEKSATGPCSLGLSHVQSPVSPLVPMASPLALRAIGETSSGAETPSTETCDSEDEAPSDPDSMTAIATPVTPTQHLLPPPVRPAMYSHASRSMINLSSPGSTTTRPILEPLPEMRPPMLAPEAPAAASLMSPPMRKRRLSDGDANALPPKYEALSSAFHHGPQPKPREEEGRERLPPYWCGVHIEGTLSRKMEFTQPGVQAKDRAWKKYYFVLHGTALFIYKFDPSRVPLRANEPYLTCDDGEVPMYLHVHPAPDRRILPSTLPSTPPRTNTGRIDKQPRRNTLEGALRGSPIGAIANRRGTVGSQTPTTREGSAGPSGPDFKDSELCNPNRRPSIAASVASSTASAPLASHMPFAHNMMVHKYTLQGAESGLAADYKKRLHCVRVRAEGQQFMLQTETARQCVQWIEAFQAATNISLDLDVRPMPVQQTLPRRRRRPGARRPPNPGVQMPTGLSTAFADTPEGNIAAVEAAERTARERAERERERMLAEDQAANIGAASLS